MPTFLDRKAAHLLLRRRMLNQSHQDRLVFADGHMLVLFVHPQTELEATLEEKQGRKNELAERFLM